MRKILSDPKAREKPCLRCGTSLRQHLDHRHCPTCGLSVWLSLNANDTLELSSPRWLGAMASGAAVLAFAQVVALAAYLLTLEYQYQLAKAIVPDPETDLEGFVDYFTPHAPPQMLLLAAVVIGVFFLVNSAGMVILSVHERRHPDRLKGPRLWLRLGAGVGVLVGLGIGAWGVRGLTGAGVRTNEGLAYLCEGVFILCGLITWVVIRHLATRGGHSGISRLCGYLLFLPLLAFLKATPFLGFYALYWLTPLLSLVPLAYIPLSIYLLAHTAWFTSRAIPQARATWHSETCDPSMAQNRMPSPTAVQYR